MRISDWSSDVCSSDLINAGSVEFDGKDIKGPLTIGATLTRQYKPAADDKEGKPHPQRIALIGDSDFLSNAYLAQLGNQQPGLNVIQWLASRDEIGRASCREGVCQDVSIAVADVQQKQTK